MKISRNIDDTVVNFISSPTSSITCLEGGESERGQSIVRNTKSHEVKKRRVSPERRENVGKKVVKYDICAVPYFVRNLEYIEKGRISDPVSSSSSISDSIQKIKNVASSETDQQMNILERIELRPSSRATNLCEHACSHHVKLRFADEKEDELKDTQGEGSVVFATERVDSAYSTGAQLFSRVQNDNIISSTNEKQKCAEVVGLHRSMMESLMGESILWVPQSREEWQNCSDEMSKLCALVAFRRKKSSPILPKTYIEERIFVDDPLRGFQIRHRFGGWLQGFILTTTFTTWTYYFKWDSLHPKSGMMSTVMPCYSKSSTWDTHGVLSSELEAQPRSGDPHEGGIIWQSVAEISVVGAMGCGEYLLRMAIDDIRERGCYKYIVLQATDMSRGFYEKFGFVRVGAIAKYGRHRKNKPPQIVGYRHWTYADEKHLRIHGGPSYMMARRIEPVAKMNPLIEDQGTLDYTSFLKHLSMYCVLEKPKITPLNCTYSLENHGESRFLCSSSQEVSIGKVNSVNYFNSAKKFCLPNDCDESQIKLENSDPDQHQDMESDKSIIFCGKDQSNLNERNNSDVETKGNNIYTPISPSRECIISSHLPVLAQEQVLYSKNGVNLVNSSKALVGSTGLRKQKVTKLHRSLTGYSGYYNKVVARKNFNRNINSYFFVTYFNECTRSIRVIQLEPRGRFCSKREGRIRWKACIDKKGTPVNEKNFSTLFLTPCTEWDVVPARMISRTSFIAKEGWDIFESYMLLETL